MKKQRDTFVHEDGNPTRLEEMRQFILEHDITEMPSAVYRIIGRLSPELPHKVNPPRELMH